PARPAYGNCSRSLVLSRSRETTAPALVGSSCAMYARMPRRSASACLDHLTFIWGRQLVGLAPAFDPGHDLLVGIGRTAGIELGDGGLGQGELPLLDRDVAFERVAYPC